MPFAPRIRKDILKALDDYIIPALQSQEILQVRAEPPFDFSSTSHWMEQQAFLPDRPHAHLQKLRRWEMQHMISVNHPTFGFAYDGIGYERIGITASTAETMKASQHPVPAGITVVRLPAPGIICYPEYCPHSAGVSQDREWYEKVCEDVKVLAFSLIGEEVLPFISVRPGSSVEENGDSHQLLVSDPMLAQLGRIYLDELRQPDNSQNAQSQLLIFMCRLRRYLHHHKPVISNSCWIGPGKTAEKLGDAKHTKLCNKVQDYIQTHLSQELSLRLLAEHVDVSPAHLNRVFREVHGITVMRHVTMLRINVAKRIIAETPERISDVAELTGFSSAASFSTVFRKMTGISPSAFRDGN